MEKWFKHTFGCIFLLHLFCYQALAADIHEIKIEGNRHVSEDKILRILRLQKGDPLEETRITEAVRRLFASKEFADIQVFKDVVQGQVILTFVVREHTKIDKIRFEGNKHIDEEDLEEHIEARPGTFMRPALLQRDFFSIEEHYREKGYYRVNVHEEIKTEADDDSKALKTVLVYKISEGEKVKIRYIDFFGNRMLESDQIRGAMSSKQDALFRGGEFKPKVLKEDMAGISLLYHKYGFLDVEVMDKELIFSEDGRHVDVFITLREGRRYRVGDVTWTGNTLFKDYQIAPHISLSKGEVFNDDEFTANLAAIQELYWDRGYIYNSVSPVKSINGDMIDVDFEITEGNPAHIREINIVGNTKTSENVIRRQLVINPGEVFSTARLRRSLREVFNLGFFAGPPGVDTNPANDDGDIDVTLSVEEKQTGQFRLGAGFSQLNSISGFIGLAETNFLGKGQTIGIDWEFSRTRQNVDLRFTEPWLMGTPTQLSLNLYNRVQNQVAQQFYDDLRRGGSIRVGRPFPWFDYTSVFGRYSYEEIELSDFSPLYTGTLRDVKWPQSTSSISLTLLRNSTDSPFQPTTGTRSTFTAEFNGGALGGDVQFQNYEVGYSWYAPLFWRFVFQFKYEMAVLDDQGGVGADVPDYELFRLGGNRRYGIRGYDFFEIVPDGNPLFLGGRYMQILSYQISIPIAPTVWGLLFWDNGNTWNSFRGADLMDMKKGAGVGIRIELPMLGVMGFDYGYGFDKLRGADWEPHISLGAGF